MQLPPELTDRLAARAAVHGQTVEELLSHYLEAEGNKRQTAEQVSLQHFRMIAEAAPLFIWMCNANMIMTYSNQRFIEYFGLPPNGMDNSFIFDWSERIHPEERQLSQETFLGAFQTRQIFRGEYRALRYDGEYRWILNEARPYFSPKGEFLGYIGGAMDIHEKKLDELALRDSEKSHQARYQALLDTSPIPIVALDKDGFITYANQRAKNFFPPELVNVSQAHYSQVGHHILDDEGKPSSLIKNPLDLILNSKNALFDHEVQVQSPAGGSYYLCVNGMPIFDRHGEIQEVIFSLENITQRKLEGQAMEASLQEEKAHNETKGRFLSMISHEFRTPLTVIMTSIEILKRQPMDEQKRLHRLERIEAQVKRLNHMLSDVTHIYKSQVKNVEVQAEYLDLAQVILSLREDILAAYPLIGDILLEISGPPQNIRADDDLIHQLLVNLLSNAAKYSYEGGKVELHLHYQSEGVEISVQDHGIGIPEEDQAHLFKLFYRGSNATHITGTGLGLVIIKNAIELHKGHLSFESQVGAGSCFRVWLPLHP